MIATYAKGKILPLFVAFLFALQFSTAATVDTIEVHSTAMNKKIKTVIVQPDGSKKDRFPTVYLLHGYSGKYSDYVNHVPHIKDLVDKLGFIAVCPDGGFGSWYWNIEGQQDWQYETFVARELTAYITANYPVYDDPKKRAITGFSMGGQGALYLSLRNQDIFGAAASSAGGVDIRPFPNNWDMAKRLGSYAENAEAWDKRTVMEMLHLIKPNSPALFIDCGRDDFFYEVNEELHRKLTYLNIPHHYQTMPGRHDWNYVGHSIRYQMTFFHQFFEQS